MHVARIVALWFALVALSPLHAAAAENNYEPIAYAYVDANAKVIRSGGRSKVLVERPSKGNYCVLLRKDLPGDETKKWWNHLPALATPAEPGAEVFMLAASTGFRGICGQYEKEDYRDGDWFAVHVTIKDLEGAFVNAEFNILVP
jgi:hypothetical protein